MSSSKNPILKVFLDGLYDDECVLSKLQGCPHILHNIWNDVTEYWEEKIKTPEDYEYEYEYEEYEGSWSRFYVAPIYGQIEFPEPLSININMMPFYVGETFEACKLPQNLKPYWKLIQLCISPELNRKQSERVKMNHQWKSDIGKVYFLTIQESLVKTGESQRRPGLHVDSPGVVNIKNQDEEDVLGYKGKGWVEECSEYHWGEGCGHVVGKNDTDTYLDFIGGIYIASNISDSCRVWNCEVDPEAVGKHGDIEHLRWAMPDDGKVMDGNQMYWITDRTPHESLPLSNEEYRQFFRIVTSKVSFWYKDHSTPNPLGVVPDPNFTKIVVGNKFSDEGVEIV